MGPTTRDVLSANERWRRGASLLSLLARNCAEFRFLGYLQHIRGERVTAPSHVVLGNEDAPEGLLCQVSQIQIGRF